MRGFSLEAHAVWTCCRPTAMSAPVWVSTMFLYRSNDLQLDSRLKPCHFNSKRLLRLLVAIVIFIVP